MFSTGRNNLNEKITITEFCVFLRYLQITERSLDQTLEPTLDGRYPIVLEKKYFRSLALSFFVCGVLVYVLIIVYDKKEEMDLESNLNIQVKIINRVPWTTVDSTAWSTGTRIRARTML